jgi:hypothetical protein
LGLSSLLPLPPLYSSQSSRSVKDRGLTVRALGAHLGSWADWTVSFVRVLQGTVQLYLSGLGGWDISQLP